MDEETYSQTKSPGTAAAEDQNPALSGGPSPMRFTVVALAFVVHFVAWIGYCALMVASSNYYFAQSLPTGIAMFVLACVAGAAAIVVARELSPIPRSIVTVLSIAIFGISGIAEVVGRVERPMPELMVLTFGEVVTLIGMFVFPFVIAGVLVAVVRKPEVAGRPTAGAVAVLLVCVVIAVCCLLPKFGVLDPTALPSWFRTELPIALSSGIGMVAAVFLLGRVQFHALSFGWSLVIRVFGFVTLACGMHLCNLSTGLLVGFYPLGDGGRMFWTGATLGFPIGAVALLVSVAAARRRLS
ncbi:hypothetical protein [Brevibacterium sp. UCMA 11754]|uniref:hypothetical protein n=1 Tax=Brevibacterium sp. UCMA 11754 TaxID=2749198 RepID=UPI001F47DDED|nr:hypothetical protein [Brevibacterium sp. UCMA 11754]MCF2570916.1 hypothetical protein [Brevibacterium sp. UCMA 11754]